MKKIDIIYLILENLDEINDDSNISEELVAEVIDNKRMDIVSKATKSTILRHLIQHLDSVPIQLVDTSSDPCFNSGITVLSTEVEIPKPMIINRTEAITKVGSLDQLETNYNLVPYNRFIYSGNGKYNQTQKYASYYNNKIYLKGSSNLSQFLVLDKIYIEAVFESPDLVEIYNNGTHNDWEYEYPIHGEHIDALTQMVIQYFAPKLQFPEDNTNNAKEK